MVCYKRLFEHGSHIVPQQYGTLCDNVPTIQNVAVTFYCETILETNGILHTMLAGIR